MQNHIHHLDIYPYYGRTEAESKGLKRLIYKLIPRHTLLPFWHEVLYACIRFKTRNTAKRHKNQKNLLVNLGAGSSGRQGWINVDIFKAPGINCVYDCRKSLPFPDDSVKGIFCEHFFEHLDYTGEVPYFLSECHRVLRPAGIIRIIVPDVEKYLQAYLKEGWEAFGRIRPLDAEGTDRHLGCKYNTRMELINTLFRQGYEHKYAYDYDTLEFLLRRYGFSAVHRQEFGRSLMDEICIDKPLRASESLYVEAVKY